MTENVYYQGGATGSGNPEVSPQPASAAALPPSDAMPELNGNEPVSKTELRALLESVKKEVTDSVLRQAQSHTDKLGSTLDKRIKSAQEKADMAIDTVKASGVSLTPDQERTVRQTAVNEAMTARDDPPTQTPTGKQVESTPQDTFVQREVEKIFKRTGVYISSDEANSLIGEVDSPYEYLKKFDEICTDRVNRPQAESRIATMFPSGGKPAGLDALQRQYDQEILLVNSGTHPTVKRGNAAQVTGLKNEYRKKGLTNVW